MTQEKTVVTKPYKDVTLEFDPEKHIYYANGARVPFSVTGITKIIDKSDGLTWWAAGEAVKVLGWYDPKKLKRLYPGEEEYRDAVAAAHKKLQETIGNVMAMTTDELFNLLDGARKEHKRTKEKAASIGQNVHEWVEQYTLGKKPKMPADDREKNGVLGFLRWISENKVKFVEVEKHLYSKKYHFAGRMDAIAKVNGDLALVDYKTSSGIYTEMRYQTAAYQAAREEMKGKPFIDCRWIVRFDKETGEFETARFDGFKPDFAAFLGAMAIQKREQELKKSKE